MTWEEFNAQVDKLLPLDSARLGTEDYIDSLKRQAVLDLQGFIPRFRVGHESIYDPDDDLTQEASSSKGELPDTGIKVTDAYILRTNTGDSTETRFPVLFDYPWDDRFALVNGQICINDNNARMTIDPYGKTFYVFPQILSSELLNAITYSSVLVLNWDGVKFEFNDGEDTPFTEKAALAVAEYCSGHISRKINKDLQGYESHAKSFQRERLALFREK